MDANIYGTPEVEVSYRWTVKDGPVVDMPGYAHPTQGKVVEVIATAFSDGEVDVTVRARKIMKNGEVDPRTNRPDPVYVAEIHKAAEEYVRSVPAPAPK